MPALFDKLQTPPSGVDCTQAQTRACGEEQNELARPAGAGYVIAPRYRSWAQARAHLK